MDLEKIFNSQQEYYKHGYSKSITYREMMLTKLLKALKAHEDQILSALEADLGKSFMEGYLSELGMLYASINHAIKNLAKWNKNTKRKPPFYLFRAKSYIKHVPYGNVLIMSAFNYPLLLALDPLVGSIVGGNTSMVALPDTTPSVNAVIIKLLSESFNRNYIHAFITNRDLNTEILKFKYNKIFYTGSSKVGKIVAKAASENLIPTTLELGGKSPALITKDANYKNAAKSIVWGKFLNAGQTCVAPDYLLVHAVVADDLINEIKASLEVMYGNDLKANADYPKIINQKELDRLLEIVDSDQDYLINDYHYDQEALHLDPVLLKTSLANVDKLVSMEAEIFGPILPIIVYSDLEAAFDYINNQETPLAYYPFATSRRDIDYLLERVTFGGATVNDTILHLSNLDLPFGGLNNSGMGNYHGVYSFETFTHKQAVLETKSSLKLTLMHPPYSKFKEKLVRLFLK